MHYKCNSKRNGMFALIRFSDTFYLVVPKTQNPLNSRSPVL